MSKSNRMTRRRLGSALVGLALCLHAIDGAAALAAPAKELIVLGETNTFRVTRSVAFEVTLAKDAVLSVDKSRPGLRPSGRGRIIAAALHRTDDDGTRAVGVTRHVLCVEKGCRPDPRLASSYLNSVSVGFESVGVDKLTIPTGRYTLSVTTDESPATVELTLKGLKGSTRVAGGTAFATTLAVGGTTTASTIGGHTASLAETGVSASVALIAFHSQALSTAHVTSAEGSCLYGPSRPPQGLVTTQCPGGYPTTQFVTTYATVDFSGYRYGAYIISSRQPSAFAVGAFSTGAKAGSDLQMLAIAIPLAS